MDPRRMRELRTLSAMARLYCESARHTAGPPCPECARLLEYAGARLQRCPFGAEKPTCRDCPTHCYAPAQREAIRAVMRSAGPRIFFRHPILALRHWINGWRWPDRSRRRMTGKRDGTGA